MHGAGRGSREELERQRDEQPSLYCSQQPDPSPGGETWEEKSRVLHLGTKGFIYSASSGLVGHALAQSPSLAPATPA